MKDIEKMLAENYAKKADTFVYEDKDRLIELYDKPLSGRVKKAVVTMRIVVAAALAAAVMTGAAASLSIRELVAIQTADANITDDKRSNIADRLEHWNIEASRLESDPIDISVNKYGETVGTLLDGGDLFAVSGVDGDVVRAFVYIDDLGLISPGIGADSELSREWNERFPNGVDRSWVYAFNEDADEIVGKYCNDGFKSWEQLKDPAVSRLFFDGTSPEELEAYNDMVKNRIEEKTGGEYIIPASSENTAPEGMMKVIGYDEAHTVGYVYLDDYEFLKPIDWVNMNWDEEYEDACILGEKRHKGLVRNWIYVYAEDGSTILGKYIVDYEPGVFSADEGMSKEEADEAFHKQLDEEYERSLYFEYGFNTSQQLEMPERASMLIDGEDSREYSAAAMRRR